MSAAPESARPRPLVATKFRPPANRGSLIQRPHLVESLSRTLDCKLALVHGPAGFGKTTLATQWFWQLRGQGISAAWLSVDASDNDLDRFLGYLTEAVRTAEPDIGVGLRETIEANPGSATDFVLDTLAKDLAVHEAPLVLFIDDWHLIRQTSVHEALQLLLARAPVNLHFVVTSRTRGGVPLARLRVQNELIEIDAAALRFDLEESRSYLAMGRSPQLAPDDVAALWRSTEGWAAALQLASLSLRSSGDHDGILQWTRGTANDIGEYLAENVISNLPAAQVAFMLRSSILERLSGELCAVVTGDPDSATRLDELEHQELFLLPLDDERLWFRYHHLFAQFLQRRLRRQFPGEVAGLHLKASQWLGQHGHIAEAVQHALHAGATGTAVELVEQAAMTLVENSSMSSLLNLVRKLPRTALFDRPQMQAAIAWANCLTHRPQEAEEALWHLERVAAGEPARRKHLLLGEASVIRACVAVYADRIDGVEALAQPCLDRADDYPPFTVGVAANVLAYRHIHSHRLAPVAPLLRWARDYQDRAQGLFSAVYGRCFEGLACYRAGQFAMARRCYEEARNLAAQSAGKQSNAARLASALLGQVLYEENQLEEAERLLKESRFLGFEGGVVDFYLATYLSLSRLAMLKGEPQDALATLDEGEDTARALSLDRLGVALACERTRVKLEVGDIRGAEHTLSSLCTQASLSASTTGEHGGEIEAHAQMARARLWCARGSADRAVDCLVEMVGRAAGSGWKRQELAAQVLLAQAQERAGQPAAAEQTLLQAIDDGVPRGMLRLFLDEGPPLVEILERLRERSRRGAARGPNTESFSATAQQLLTLSRHPQQGLPRYAGSAARVADLTAREMEVLSLLDQGMANKEIARALDISVDTVKWFLKNVFGKLGVSTRTQAIGEARKLGLFDPPRAH